MSVFVHLSLLKGNAHIMSYKVFLFCFNHFCVLMLCKIFMEMIISPRSSPWYNSNGWLGVKHQVTYLPPSLENNDASSSAKNPSLPYKLPHNNCGPSFTRQWLYPYRCDQQACGWLPGVKLHYLTYKWTWTLTEKSSTGMGLSTWS